MGKSVGERRAEDDLQPIYRIELAVDDGVADRRLHPAVCREDPERGKERAERDHYGSDKMRPGRHQGAAEQQHPEERCLEKESHQVLIGQKRADDVSCGIGQAAPVGAELERHHYSGHHPHAEGDREDPNPEIRDAQVHRACGSEMQSFEQGDVGCGADGEGRQQDVPPDDPSELDSRKKERIERH